jgi:hypothetical protein
VWKFSRLGLWAATVEVLWALLADDFARLLDPLLFSVLRQIDRKSVLIFREMAGAVQPLGTNMANTMGAGKTPMMFLLVLVNLILELMHQEIGVSRHQNEADWGQIAGQTGGGRPSGATLVVVKAHLVTQMLSYWAKFVDAAGVVDRFGSHLTCRWPAI